MPDPSMSEPVCPVPASPEPVRYESRSQIDPRYMWDLSCMFASDDDFLAGLDAAKGYAARFAELKGAATASADGLLSYLKLDDEANVLLSRLVNYAERKSDEDARVSRYRDFASQARSVCVAVAGSQAWFPSELLALDPQTLEGYYRDCPDLELYRRELDGVLRMRAHTLSSAEEALLAAAGDVAAQPDSIFSALNDADLAFPDAHDAQGAAHPVTHGGYVPLLMSADRTLRRSAYESLYGVYAQFRTTCAAILEAQTKQLKFFADARRYPSSLACALDATEVPVEVYTNLVGAVRRNIGALHRYIALRKRVLGVDELHGCDLYVPLVDDVEMRFTYEEACSIVLEALKPLGEDYLAIVRQGLAQRWVDVYETPGKRSGAYSAGGYGMHPVILLNFQGTLDDVFTLAHEMGHSVHTYLSCANRPPCYADYVIFVAEVASTCNEALLMHYFLERAKDARERAYLLNHYLEQFRTTLFRQCMFAEFELTLNGFAERGEGTTPDALCAAYRALNEDYFGPAFTSDDQIALEWARIPHFYYNYYVYQYATGFSAAVALSQRILNEGEPAVKDYLGFLSGGSSQPPIELLRGAGVDMATAQPIDEALGLFGRLVDELANLLEAGADGTAGE